MYFRKALVFIFVIVCGMVLSACQEKPTLETLTFSGADNVALEYEEEFNVLEGVTVIGNDGVDYSDIITYTSLATINKETHLFDTTKAGQFLIRYSVEVGEVKASRNRMITIKAPERTSMILNGDFSMGTTGWDVYEADGGTMKLSIDEGALKMEIVSGTNPWTPRITQMDVPFEEGKTYEITFRAKSSVEGKLIHLQVGELLAHDPWFVNFKPNAQVEFATLTTDWENYSYKFTHTQDNTRGGLLFEFGRFKESNISCDVWMDDIDIKESTPDADTAPPVFFGLNNEVTINLNTAFNPLAGVTAEDAVDGDVTDKIQVKIFKVEGEVETEVQVIDVEVVGEYKIVYTVTDEAGNKAEESIKLFIVVMQFVDTDIIENGDFADIDPRPWTHWSQNWGEMPTVTVEYIDEQAVITYDIPGDAGWAIQFNQEDITLERGVTYRVQFDAKATVARSINLAMEDPTRNDQQFFRQNGIEITTNMETYEFIFTVIHETSSKVKLSFELGATNNFQAGTLTFDNVKISKAIIDDVLYNKDFTINGYRSFVATWLGAAADLVVEDGALKLDISNVGGCNESWNLQIIQDAYALGTGADNVGHIQFEAGKTYKLTFDAKSSKTGKVNVAFGHNVSGWAAYYVTPTDNQPEVTTEWAAYTVEFTIDETVDVTYKSQLKFEVGALYTGETTPQFFMVDNIKLEIKDGYDFNNTNQVVNGTITEAVGWGLVVADWEGAAGSMALNQDGNLEINVAAIGNDAWHVHLHNGETNSLPAGDYRFVLKVSSSEARALRANLTIPSDGFTSILPDTKWDVELDKDEIHTFELQFTVESDLLNKVKVEINFGPIDDLTSVPSTIIIYEINIFRVI